MSSPPIPISGARAPDCAPPEVTTARVSVLADGGVMATAEHAAEVLRSDGHDLAVIPVGGMCA
ncbi:MAG TPA: hypothetical protein VG276_31705 [Actinomycetes bacterium]|jgi:hypothetical protein|nr:hypothetical protein [Actinomycetes bacterium]